MADVNPVDLIIQKRDGQQLDAESIQQLIKAYTADKVPDYQMSAFLMASYLNGLNQEESAALTDAMLHSGTVLDLSGTPGIKVDKHSTGGVGDKVSLILAPIVSACGVPVPMISGRGLGHTGGTLDKLESIPGFRTDLSVEAYKQQLADIGIVMIGQTEWIAPADRRLYALRDVTGTVESIPLIAASIMSKKLAEGIDSLVLDVKCGRGAFMKSESDARRLAETLVGIGESANTDTIALMTRMDVPLGRAVGNWPEVVESIGCLRGNADELHVPDLMAVTIALAGEMLVLGGVAETPEEGRAMAREAVNDGSAFEKLETLVDVQHGDTSVLHDPSSRPGSEAAAEIHAPDHANGYVGDINALLIGRAALALGAGRRTKEDDVDPTAGLLLRKKPGDSIRGGEVLATCYGQSASSSQAAELVQQAFNFTEDNPVPPAMLMGRYTSAGWDEPAQS